MTRNKKHWYDGWIYDRMISPHQADLFFRIRSFIKEGSSVIDVGCGPGRMDLLIADKCSKVIGIDLSVKNIKTATESANRNSCKNVFFIHSDLPEIAVSRDNNFDYAVFSLILHEINPDERIKLLKSAVLIADRIIVADYHPETGAIQSAVRGIIEFFAGREHFKNYRNYISNGGMSDLMKKAGLKAVYEEVHKSFIRLAVLNKTSLL
jgi:SAM-dependent methyltransferase